MPSGGTMAVPVSSVCELTRKRDDERNCCSLYRAVEDNTGFKIQDHRERSSHVLSGGQDVAAFSSAVSRQGRYSMNFCTAGVRWFPCFIASLIGR